MGLLARGLSGGIAIACAFVAMSLLDIAEANVLMFTNPAWTGVLAWLILRQAWRGYDQILCIVAFVGVVLVVGPPYLHGRGPPHGPPYGPPPGPPRPPQVPQLDTIFQVMAMAEHHPPP